MLRYMVHRLMQGLLTLALMTVIIFFLGRVGSNPINTMLSFEASEKTRTALIGKLGLDRPLTEQYWKWMKLLAHGDLGKSFLRPHTVTHLLKESAPNTFKLGMAAVSLALLCGIPLGVLAGVWRGKAIDTLARTLAVLGQSAPLFWVGLILMYFFAIKWHLFPILGSTGIAGSVLPSVSLALYLLAGVTRLTRSAMIEAMEADFITLARIKGLSESAVIFRHALRNALIPIVTYGGMYFTLMMSGAVVVEVVFAWPGMGLLLFNAALGGDYMVLQGTMLFVTATVIIGNIMVDIAYAWIDPRIRYQRA